MTRRNQEQMEEERLARQALENRYANMSNTELKDEVMRLLNEIEDLAEQRKAHMDSFKEVIDEKKDQVKYCRELISTVNRQQLETAATELLEQ